MEQLVILHPHRLKNHKHAQTGRLGAAGAFAFPTFGSNSSSFTNRTSTVSPWTFILIVNAGTGG